MASRDQLARDLYPVISNYGAKKLGFDAQEAMRCRQSRHISKPFVSSNQNQPVYGMATDSRTRKSSIANKFHGGKK